MAGAYPISSFFAARRYPPTNVFRKNHFTGEDEYSGTHETG